MDWLKQATGLWDGDDTRNEAIKTESMINADGTISYDAGGYGWVSEEEYRELEKAGKFRLGQQAWDSGVRALTSTAQAAYGLLPDQVEDQIEQGVSSAISNVGKGYSNLPLVVRKGIGGEEGVPSNYGLEGLGRTALAPFQAADTVLEGVSKATNIGKGPLEGALTAAEIALSGGTSTAMRKGLVPKIDDATAWLLRNADELADGPAFYAGMKLPGGNDLARKKAMDLVSPEDAIQNYRALTEYPDTFIDPITGRKVKGWTITNVHHVNELSFSRKAAAAHASFELVKPGVRSPLIEYVEAQFKIFSGNSKSNLADVLAIDGGKFRNAKIKAIRNRWGNDNISASTVNDLLRTSDPDSLIDPVSGLKIKNPERTGKTFAELKPEQYTDLEAWRKKYPNEEYPGWTDKRALIGKDHFPMIRIKDGNGNLIENWRPQTIEEYQNRWKYVQNKLGIEKPINLNTIKVDPKLNLLGGDHDLIHGLQNTFKKTPGNPLYELEAAIANGTFRDMPIPEAGRLYAEAHLFQERVCAHVLSERYAHIQKLWSKAYPNGQGGAKTFEQWGKAAQQRFFRKHVAKISVAGGLNPSVTLEKAQTAFENWTPGMANVFGWSPNTAHLDFNRRSQLKAMVKDIKSDL